MSSTSARLANKLSAILSASTGSFAKRTAPVNAAGVFAPRVVIVATPAPKRARSEALRSEAPSGKGRYPTVDPARISATPAGDSPVSHVMGRPLADAFSAPKYPLHL